MIGLVCWFCLFWVCIWGSLGCLCLPSLLLAMFAVIVLCNAELFLYNGVCMPFGLVGFLFDSRSSNKKLLIHPKKDTLKQKNLYVGF